MDEEVCLLARRWENDDVVARSGQIKLWKLEMEKGERERERKEGNE